MPRTGIDFSDLQDGDLQGGLEALRKEIANLPDAQQRKHCQERFGEVVTSLQYLLACLHGE